MATNTIRARAQAGANGNTEIRLLINHPMTMERVDPATGQRQPAHFIEELTATHKGDTVFSALWGQAISQNPYVAFSIAGVAKGDVVTVQWRDTKGDTDSLQLTVG